MSEKIEPCKLFDAEFKFLSLVWEQEPINSTALSKVCEAALGWKKSTTYTMLRKLCQRGILCNEAAMVTSLINREQVQQYESEVLLEKAFDRSLPSFVAAFLRDKTISAAEAATLKKLIEEATKK